MKVFDTFRDAFRAADLRSKILFTLGMLLDGLWALPKRFWRLPPPLPATLCAYSAVVPAC